MSPPPAPASEPAGERQAYVPPTIVAHQSGLANKFGRGPTRRSLTRIDGVPVTDLVERFGTPLFVFGERRLRRRFRDVQRTFNVRWPKVQFAWSYKTNHLDAVCRIFHDEGAWAEVVSEVEYAMARRLGVPGEQIVFNGPYKPTESLRTAVAEGAHIHIDHHDELWDLERIACEHGRPVPVAIRVNMDTGTYPRWGRFGFDLDGGEALDVVRRIAASPHLELGGLHTHIGTYMLAPEAYGIAATKLVELAQRARELTGRLPRYLDLGGGFASHATLHAQYSPASDTVPPIEAYADAITTPLLAAGFRADEAPTLILETGRALVDDAGSLIARVVASKRLPGGARAIVIDAGLNVLFTSLWYRHEVLPALDRGGLFEDTTVFGPLCMNIDVVRPSVLLPPLEVGDPLVIRPVGAYNVTQSLQFIRLRPAMVLIGDGGQIDLIRRAEELDDLKGPERLPDRLAPGHAR